MMETRDVVRHFYDGLARRDDSWQQNLAHDVVFADASGRLQARGRDAFVQSFTPFLRGVSRVELKQLVVEDTAAAAVVSYDYVNAKGEHLHQDDAEIWRVEDGEVKALTIFFDITEFRAFMGR
jgi:ketosteroid isomerase-like protein